jgi:hypothetical protein
MDIPDDIQNPKPFGFFHSYSYEKDIATVLVVSNQERPNHPPPYFL